MGPAQEQAADCYVDGVVWMKNPRDIVSINQFARTIRSVHPGGPTDVAQRLSDMPCRDEMKSILVEKKEAGALASNGIRPFFALRIPQKDNAFFCFTIKP